MNIDFRSSDGCRINASQGDSNKHNFAGGVREADGKMDSIISQREWRDFHISFDSSSPKTT